MLPILFPAIVLLLAAASDTSPSDSYGAVSRVQGGRGPDAGGGIATQLGGRSPGTPYRYSSPSSVVTGWNTFEVQ